MKTSVFCLVYSAICAGTGLVACGDAGNGELVGSAQIAITQVPVDVSCVQISAQGVARSAQRSFDVAPGQSSVLSMQSLPTGNVTFSGLGFSVPCASVTSSTVAPWQSDPTPAIVPTSGAPAQVALVMRRNGRASISVDFQDDPTATGGTGGTGGAATGGTGTGGSGTGGAPGCGDHVATPGEFCFPAAPNETLAAPNSDLARSFDADGDGSPDLLISSSITGELSLFRNQGGALALAAQTALPPIVGMATGNFRQLPTQEVAVASSDGSLRLLDGTLQQVSQIAAFFLQPSALAAGDFNGDGRLDLVVGGNGGNVSVLLETGPGSFGPPVQLGGFPAGVSALAVADVNGDGLADVIAAEPAAQSITVAISLGGNAFNALQIPIGIPSPAALALADFNGDGRVDIAVSSNATPQMLILAGTGSAVFNPLAQQSLGTFVDMAAGDFNHDGHADLVGADSVDGLVFVALGDGTGLLNLGAKFPASQPRGVVAPDFNGDTVTDFAVATSTGAAVWLSNP